MELKEEVDEEDSNASKLWVWFISILTNSSPTVPLSTVPKNDKTKAAPHPKKVK